MPPTVPCPSCGRPNAPHRATCLYCGADLPSPSALPPAPAPRKELPKDLDEAFQRAMLQGDMRQLREVLGAVEARPTVFEPSEAPPAVRAPVGLSASSGPSALDSSVEPLALPAQASAPPELPVLPPPSIDELYVQLSQAVVLAGSWEDDPRAAAGVLSQARETLDLLVEQLGERESPPPLVLPPFRQPYALVVDSPGDDARLREVAQALGVDLATARQVAVRGHPQAALRSADQAELEGLAARYREALGLPAVVLDEGLLRDLPSARLVLSLAAEGPWRWAVSSSWEPDTSAIAGLSVREVPPSAPRLVVVGEVVITRFREQRGRRKDDGRLASHGDRRLRVLDLHHDDAVLRVVEGITQLSGWPTLDPRSTSLAFHGLSEALEARFPGVTVLGRRICQPTRQPEARGDGRMEAAGWPAWEEHSRSCRALFLG